MSKIFLIFILLITYSVSKDNVLKEFIDSIDNLKNAQTNSYTFDENIFKKLRLNINYSEFKESVQDEYEIRAYPKWISQIDTEKEIFNLKKRELNILQKDNYRDLLKEYYFLIIDTYFKRKFYLHTKKIIEIKEKQLDILTKNSDNISNIVDIAKLKYEIENIRINLKTERRDYKNMILYIHNSISQYDIDSIDRAFENFNFKNIDNLTEYIKNFNQNIEKSLQKEIINIELAKKSKKLKEIENYFRINSLDVKYENDKNSDNEFSIGFSLEMAFGENSNMDEKLNILSENMKLNIKKESLKSENFKMIREIFSLKSNIIDNRENIKNDKFYDSYIKLESPNPIVILDLRLNHLKIQKNIIISEYKIYKKIISLFYNTNNLKKTILFED